MGYFVEFKDGDKVAMLDKPHMMRGSIIALGGTIEATLHITYNYSKLFRKVLGENGILELNGKKSEDIIPLLKNAIEKLSDDISEDYWEATEGNAKIALKSMLSLAEYCKGSTIHIS